LYLGQEDEDFLEGGLGDVELIDDLFLRQFVVQQIESFRKDKCLFVEFET
jgi:hypothetical protein